MPAAPLPATTTSNSGSRGAMAPPGTMLEHVSVLSLDARLGGDRLREPEEPGWIVLGLDRRQPRVVRAVVRLAPVGQVGVNVVLVRLPAGVRVEVGVERAQPVVLPRDPGGRAWKGAPGVVLGQ